MILGVMEHIVTPCEGFLTPGNETLERSDPRVDILMALQVREG